MKINEILAEAKSAHPQQAAIAISMKKAGKKPKSQVNELAPSPGGPDSGDYFRTLASAWYNGAYDSGSLQKGIKTNQDIERLLQRGIVAPDGVARKYNIDYNSDFDGVIIFSDDYYEHGDHDNTDSRTGKPFGPYDYMEFSDDELSEGIYESAELEEEFDLIESIIERLAQHNGVDAEVIWEDLETLTEDELYAFAVTSEPIMESTRKGEYGRVLDALGLYYPRISMEELNTPGYYQVIANKADVPVEYAAQVIDGFVNDDRYYDNEDDEEQGVAEGSNPEKVEVRFSAKEYAAMTPAQKAAKQKEWQQLKQQAKMRMQNFTLIDTDKEQGVAEAEPVPGKYSGHFYDAKLLPNGDYEVIKINSKKDDKGNTNPLDLKVGSIVPKGKAHSLQYANDGGMFDEINRAERSAQFRAQQKGVAEGSEWETRHDEFTTVGDRATPEQINKIVSALGVAAKQAGGKRGFLNKIVGKQSNGDLARMAYGAETLAKNIQRNSNAKPGTDERKELGQHLVYAVSLLKRINGEQGVMEDWQKANKRDRTDGMSQKAVNAYRRENPGSKLKTAVTTKPSKLKRGSKASKRRKSYCSRSRGQMKMHSISCAKTPDKAICKARRRWNC
jgi:hypothetical protein